jgi:hypothetical protein
LSESEGFVFLTKEVVFVWTAAEDFDEDPRVEGGGAWVREVLMLRL